MINKLVKKNNTDDLIAFVTSLVSNDFTYTIDPSNFIGKQKQLAQLLVALQQSTIKRSFELEVASDRLNAITYELNRSIANQDKISAYLYEEGKQMEQMNTSNAETVDTAVNDSTALSNSSKEILNIFSKLQLTGEESGKSIENQSEEILEIARRIDILERYASKNLEEINDLHNAVQQIYSTLSVVEDFARQTQLLSFNASIEAARAGEFGRGFAVVASEIRTLADSSNKAVEKITTTLSTLTSSMDDVVENTEKSIRRINRVVASTKELEVGLKNIDEAYQKVYDQIDAVTSHAQSNSKKVEGIVSNINQLYSSSQELASGIEVVNNSVEHEKIEMDRILKLRNELLEVVDGLTFISTKSHSKLFEVYREKMSDTAGQILERIQQEMHTNKEILELQMETHQVWLDKLVKGTDYIEAAWTNNQNGDFIYSYPSAGISNASIREWFQSCIKGDTYISEIYISAITRKPCITIATPMSRGNDIIGVVGVDIKVTIEF